MSDAEIEKTLPFQYLIVLKNLLQLVKLYYFKDFKGLYWIKKDEEDDEVKGLLPPVSTNEILYAKEIKATQRFSQPPARYTEASLVKKLEELGISRRFYICSNNHNYSREYVVKNNRVGNEENILNLFWKRMKY